jgi:hypothetical protein
VVLHRALAGALDDRPVGHRIGKGHAQLDDVGARRNRGVHQFDGLSRVWITGH